MEAVATKKYLLVIFLVISQLSTPQCYKSRPSRPSPSRPSPSRPTYRAPTPSPHRPFPSPTHRPFPTHAPTHRPFPTHAPTYRPFPTHAPTHRPFPTHAPTYRPFPTHAPTHRPFPTHSPTYRPTPAPTYRPFPTHSPTYRPTQAPTYRPFPTHGPTHRPYPTQAPTYRPFPTYRPNPTHAPTYRPHTNYPTSYPNNGGRRPTVHPPPKYPTQPQRYPIGPPANYPSYPGYKDSGIFVGRPYQPSYSVPVRVPYGTGKTKIKVYNINNYHPSSYWAPPSYPVYRYTYRDTGNSALGFYLGYSLGRISHPTYYHRDHVFYDGYSPRYDHYTVHHYYHNTGSIPKEQTITTKVIIQCGDTSQICPEGTTALCTASGQIMCVVVQSNTVPCKDNPSLRCVQSKVPCENNESPECKGVAKGETTAIHIPCISNTTVEGNIKTVNNTIISTEPKNETSIASSTTLKSLLPTTITTLETTTSKALPITTLPSNIDNSTVPDLGSRRKRQAPPQYCVTIVAEPSKRQLTEGEQVFNEATNVFQNFISKAFRMGGRNTNEYPVPTIE